MRIVFDLDGTLANGDHRLHHIKKPFKDWDSYFDACDDDEPIVHALEVLRCLWFGPPALAHQIEIWSGRSEGELESVRTKTLIWLRRAVDIGFFSRAPDGAFFGTGSYIHVRMRPHGDHRPDVELKRGWLTDARAAGRAPDLVFDDRDSVVAMWRAEGVPCFQVAPGDF